MLIAALIAAGICYGYFRRNPLTTVRTAPTWDCGFGGLTPRMQYTSSSFTMPFRRIFAKVWIVDEQISKETKGAMNQEVASVHYQLQIHDHSWPHIYTPIAQGVNDLARQVGRIQTGNIRTYLGYSFVTLILLLWLIS